MGRKQPFIKMIFLLVLFENEMKAYTSNLSQLTHWLTHSLSHWSLNHLCNCLIFEACPRVPGLFNLLLIKTENNFAKYSNRFSRFKNINQYITMSRNKDQGGAGIICGTSLYIASSLYRYIASPKTYFLIMDANIDVRS